MAMTLSPDLAAPADVERWLAAERVTNDVITPTLVDRFVSMLGKPVPHAQHGDPAPLALHWTLGPDGIDAATLGSDGRPQGTPGAPSFAALPSAMWAGAETKFLRPLRVGDAVEHRARLESLVEKNGKNGRLVFATTNHDYGPKKGSPCVSEKWSAVYKGGGAALGAQASLEGPGDRFERSAKTTELMLFQYSALTYNAHRIHFDHPYTTQVERYPALVVHGPLTATLLIDTCSDKVGADAIESVSLRAMGPAYCGVTLNLLGRRNGREVEMLAQTDTGALVMRASFVLRG